MWNNPRPKHGAFDVYATIDSRCTTLACHTFVEYGSRCGFSCRVSCSSVAQERVRVWYENMLRVVSGGIFDQIYATTATNGGRPTFWYSLINQYFILSTLDLLDLDQGFALLKASATAWGQAATAMHNNYSHTGFNWSTMQPYDNGKWTEGDSAGGVAWLGVVAAESISPSGKYLDMAKGALDYLEGQTASPLYECVMPMGVLAAARMNAKVGALYARPAPVHGSSWL